MEIFTIIIFITNIKICTITSIKCTRYSSSIYLCSINIQSNRIPIACNCKVMPCAICPSICCPTRMQIKIISATKLKFHGFNTTTRVSTNKPFVRVISSTHYTTIGTRTSCTCVCTIYPIFNRKISSKIKISRGRNF